MSDAAMPQEVLYPALDIPADGTGRVEVVEGVYWLRFPLPFALDHINLWLLADGDGWTLVDCGIGLESTRELWQELIATQLDGRPIKRIIVTHYHPDHLGQAAWLSRYFHAPVWMTETEYAIACRVQQADDQVSGERLAAFFTLHGLDTERTQEIAARGNRYRQLVPELPETINPLGHGDLIRIGEYNWQVIIGGGHAPEHVCLYCAERTLLISGDQLLPRISSNVSVYPDMPDIDPLGDYLASLSELSALPATLRILPSHGQVFEGLHVRVEQLQVHHQERLQQLQDVCVQPRSAAEVLDTLFHRPLDNHQIVFAMGEAIAHLNYLHLAGLVDQSGEGDILRFRTRCT